MASSSNILPKGDLTAVGFMVTSAAWMAVGALMGLTSATELIAPDLLGNLAWIVFGRVRAIHTNLVLFGFVVPGLLASAFYFFPRLLKTELYSEYLGLLSVLIWNFSLLTMLISCLC